MECAALAQYNFFQKLLLKKFWDFVHNFFPNGHRLNLRSLCPFGKNSLDILASFLHYISHSTVYLNLKDFVSILLDHCRGLSWVWHETASDMVLLFGRSVECGISLHCHYFPVNSNIEWLYLRIPSMSQIGQFKNYWIRPRNAIP